MIIIIMRKPSTGCILYGVRHNFLFQTTAQVKYRLAHGPWTVLMVQNIIEDRISLPNTQSLNTYRISSKTSYTVKLKPMD